jgi:hypothetical protein
MSELKVVSALLCLLNECIVVGDLSATGKEEERLMFQQMQAVAQKQVDGLTSHSFAHNEQALLPSFPFFIRIIYNTIYIFFKFFFGLFARSFIPFL